MSLSPPNKSSKRDNALFERPPGIIREEKRWLFLKDRYHLTSRELQVAILVCRGFSNDEISEALKITHGTVKTHLRNLYRRVRVRSRIPLLLKFVDDINRFYGGIGPEKPAIPIKEVPVKPSETTKQVPKV